MLRFEPVKIDTSSSDENGRLVFLDDYLIAVVVQLADPSHGSARSRWHFEVTFDSLRYPLQTFDSLEEVERWLASNLHSK